jgi:ABC-type transport system involved in multi-copper enzyme maturation permease subunit
MNPTAAFYIFGWLIRDTFRQSVASRVFWIMLAVSALAVLFCLSVNIEGGDPLKIKGDTELYGRDNQPLTGPNPNPGHLSLGFGAIQLPLFRDGEAEIHFVMALLAKWVAGTGGLLLALVWTAGFLPDFLQPAAASILLAKPVPRWCLLAGKYVGVVLFVLVQALIFFLGTWLALGLRTGYWPGGYLLAIPLLVLQFAMIYGFSVLLATWTRSTVACLFGGILFWMVCFGLNYGRHATLAWAALTPEAAALPDSFRLLTECCYWLLPKPADLLMLLDGALGVTNHFGTLPEFAYVQDTGQVIPELSILTSLLFAGALVLISARKLARVDY